MPTSSEHTLLLFLLGVGHEHRTQPGRVRTLIACGPSLTSASLSAEVGNSPYRTDEHPRIRPTRAIRPLARPRLPRVRSRVPRPESHATVVGTAPSSTGSGLPVPRSSRGLADRDRRRSVRDSPQPIRDCRKPMCARLQAIRDRPTRVRVVLSVERAFLRFDRFIHTGVRQGVTRCSGRLEIVRRPRWPTALSSPMKATARATNNTPPPANSRS